MEKHYICDECGTESKNLGTCQNDLCIKQGVALKECRCEDGKHSALMEATSQPSVVSGENPEEGEESVGRSETVLDLDADEGN